MGNGMFNTTRWSLVIGTRADSDDGRAALETLCCAYRSPVAAYLRARGHPPSDADDMTQAFFEQLLRRRMHAMADPGRVRFRGFLLASLRNFLSSQREHDNAGKRGGGQAVHEGPGELRSGLRVAQRVDALGHEGGGEEGAGESSYQHGRRYPATVPARPPAND